MWTPRPSRILALLAVLGLTACMSPSPYAPRLEGQTTGFTDQALTPNRYRVTFTGNTATPRETVEGYLLLRSAEVARAAGYEHFVFDTRNTKANTTYHATPGFADDPFYGPGAYGGYGRAGFGLGTGFGRGFGYGGGFGYGSGLGYPYDPSVDIVTRTNYEAYAEIVLLTPNQAANETRALKASDVIQHLMPPANPAGQGRKAT